MSEPLILPEYTIATVAAMVLLVVAELVWVRSGVFVRLQYWLTMAIVFFFQVLVDGWLTKLVDPIVLYSPEHFSGVRFPFDIPIEDFGFGFVLVTAAIMAWCRLEERERERGATH